MAEAELDGGEGRWRRAGIEHIQCEQLIEGGRVFPGGGRSYGNAGRAAVGGGRGGRVGIVAAPYVHLGGRYGVQRNVASTEERSERKDFLIAEKEGVGGGGGLVRGQPKGGHDCDVL